MKKTYAELCSLTQRTENDDGGGGIGPKYDILNTIKKKKYDYEKYSAGVLPFFIKNKTIYFLLGRDSDGKWSDFGGRSEMGDNGRWDVTAAREFYEETIGSVIELSTMITKLQMKKNYIRIQDKTLGNSDYYMYVVRIPYNEIYRHNFHSTLSFLKYTAGKQNGTKKYLEKNDIQWVSIDTIKNSMVSDLEEYPLRPIFKRTLEGNLQKIVEFCEIYMGNGHNVIYEQ
jgi:hypothetical protein